MRLALLALCAALALFAPGASSAAGDLGSVAPVFQPALFGQGALRPASGSSSTRSKACTDGSGVICSTVVVPLDRTGVVPGTISLHVEVLPPPGVSRGAIFLIAGGPGQGSAHVYGLDDEQQASFLRFLFPGYTLVAYDDRGTGDSGLLDCRPLQIATTADEDRNATADCANQLGPNRDFYSTGDHAADLDAVRASLGIDKVALLGVSYGTKLALAYALAFPQHVERLLLVSVLPTTEPDPFSTNVLKAMPGILNAFCSDGSCKSATSNFASDVATVANRLAAKPLHGTILVPGEGPKKITVDGLEVLSVILDSDLSPGLAAELPAVMRAARQGNTQPLIRMAAFDQGGNQEESIDLSAALYVATDCHDGPFPWSPDTPIPDRTAIEQAAIAALPPGSFGPFGSWAARFGNADSCILWPSPSGGAPFGPGPLPDVPMLAISGAYDMRTPTADAAAITAQFPQGHLLVVPGVGHDALDADVSGCAARAVNSWMTGGAVPTACARGKPFVLNVPGLPPPGPAKARSRLSAAGTYGVVTKSVREAEAAWVMTVGLSGGNDPVPGIFGGRFVPVTVESFRLVNYSVARGVAVSGTIKVTGFGPPFTFQGTLSVSGARAQRGLLGLNGNSLKGTLGGKFVG